MTIKQALDELGFKSIGNIAQVLFKRFPGRRQNKFKPSTKLSDAEVQALREFKHGCRNFTVTGGQ